MKLIYVASPYVGDIEQNTEFARKACRHVMNEGHAFLRPICYIRSSLMTPIRRSVRRVWIWTCHAAPL